MQTQRLTETARIALRFKLPLTLLAVLAGAGVCLAQADDAARWRAEAQRVTIARDDWGIAHVHGKTDADAVFGIIYAQCEDDFNRVEMNYLTSLGRVAEAEGEKAIWADLRQRLFVDPEELKKDYAESPAWLKALMDAWADGVNLYLATHKEVKPKVIAHFEPWMALSFTEGSIGGDIEKIDLHKLEYFYQNSDAGHQAEFKPWLLRPDAAPTARASLDSGVEPEPRGSNGIAIAPKLTKDVHALLLINPHTSFFFRSELQMTSDEGLNAYGAVTWGQFFIYQGFNDRAGWMHTSSNVDAVDEFIETHPSNEKMTYKYGDQERKYVRKQTTLRYATPEGMLARTFYTYSTAHGPITRMEDAGWVATELMNTPVKALEQSYLRTKARNYADYRRTMELMANSSNNTIYADAEGTIAYWHGNFIPRRDTKFDYTKPVDGSDPATDWHGLLSLDEVPQLRNPAKGWLFNVNDSPWNGAGENSLKKADFPAYVEEGIESARGVHAVRVLNGKSGWTLDSLMDAAYDAYLPWFARTIPALLATWDALPQESASKKRLRGPIDVLRGWDARWSEASVATSLAVYWGTELLRSAGIDARRAGLPSEEYVAAKVEGDALLSALGMASDKLAADFGSWKTPWGEINRFQRLTGDIVQPFNDAAPSVPVPFVSSLWGSLASFGARQYPGTKRWYGTSGNSFVAVVEFGPTVRAFAVTAGGESGHPESKHFNDEAQRYARGKLREVYFYPEQMKGHTERTYRPGI